MSLRFDFSLAFLSVICCEDLILRRLVSHGWLKFSSPYIFSLGLIHFYAPIYEPWPDVQSVLLDVGQSGSPLGLSVLMYKIGIGRQQIYHTLIHGSSDFCRAPLGTIGEGNMILTFRKRVAKSLIPFTVSMIKSYFSCLEFLVNVSVSFCCKTKFAKA